MRLVDNMFNSMVGKGSSSPYIDCDYLESDGNGQFIDTGVCVGGDWSIEIDNIWLYGNSGSISDWICGARNGYSISDYSIRGQRGGFRMRYYTDMPDSNAITYQHYYSYQRHRNDLTIYDGDVIFYHRVPTLRTTTPVYTHYLFATNNAGSAIAESYTKRIGTVRIYDSNDVLVRDYRSKIRREDGVTGFYDVVNDTFNPSANGVNFLYGYLT